MKSFSNNTVDKELVETLHAAHADEIAKLKLWFVLGSGLNLAVTIALFYYLMM